MRNFPLRDPWPSGSVVNPLAQTKSSRARVTSMRSAIAFLLLLLCAVAVAPGRPVAHAPPRSSSTADAAQAIMPSVAVVRVEKRGHWGVVPVMGSGVVVAPGHILTCAHIVANSSKVAVELGVSKFEAKIIA